MRLFISPKYHDNTAINIKTKYKNINTLSFFIDKNKFVEKYIETLSLV